MKRLLLFLLACSCHAPYLVAGGGDVEEDEHRLFILAFYQKKEQPTSSQNTASATASPAEFVQPPTQQPPAVPNPFKKPTPGQQEGAPLTPITNGQTPLGEAMLNDLRELKDEAFKGATTALSTLHSWFGSSKK